MTEPPPGDLGELYRASAPYFDSAKKHFMGEVERLLEMVIPDHYVVARVKSPRSLIRKIRAAPASPQAWDSVKDKVGVRVICSTKKDCRRADDLVVGGPWEVVERVVKSGAPDQLYYPGIHITVISEDVKDHRDVPIPCEIQIRTRAQDAWAVISHKLSYKGVVKPPPKMQRLIDRLTVVVEMFDDEVQRLFKKRARLPMYDTAVKLEHLEDKFEELTGEVAEASDDLTTISILMEAYEASERAQFSSLVDGFCEARADLAELLAQHSVRSETYRDSADWLFTQPEVLAVLERATNRRHLLLNAVQGTDFEDVVRTTCAAAGLQLPAVT